MKNIIDIKKIAEQLNRLGLKNGDTVLVHSSLSALGYVHSGAETVISAIEGVLGEEGTLLFPSLSYLSVHSKNPRFNRETTPSNVGTIPEYFRNTRKPFRSLNPTHSVCGTGPGAEELLKDHHLDATPCGPNSPYRRLSEKGGKILFLGCGLRPNTSMHGVEELVEPPYLFGETIEYLIEAEGEPPFRMINRHHNFEGYVQRYDRIKSILTVAELKCGPVLNGDAWLVDAEALWKKGKEALRENPLYFVDNQTS